MGKWTITKENKNNNKAERAKKASKKVQKLTGTGIAKGAKSKTKQDPVATLNERQAKKNENAFVSKISKKSAEWNKKYGTNENHTAGAADALNILHEEAKKTGRYSYGSVDEMEKVFNKYGRKHYGWMINKADALKELNATLNEYSGFDRNKKEGTHVKSDIGNLEEQWYDKDEKKKQKKSPLSQTRQTPMQKAAATGTTSYKQSPLLVDVTHLQR